MTMRSTKPLRSATRPLPQNAREWAAEIADAYADAFETLPFMPLVSVAPDERDLFHLAPQIAIKFRDLPRRQVEAATEAALCSYVASKQQAGPALENPRIAFAFCYLAAQFGLNIVTEPVVADVMEFIEEDLDEFTRMIAQRLPKETVGSNRQQCSNSRRRNP